MDRTNLPQNEASFSATAASVDKGILFLWHSI